MQAIKDRIQAIVGSVGARCGTAELYGSGLSSSAAFYFAHCLAEDTWGAGGMTIYGADQLDEELAEGVAPGSYLLQYGYAVFAGSVGGNALVVKLETGAVYWADGEGLCSDSGIDYEVRTLESPRSGKWKSTEWGEEGLQKALVLVSPDLEAFLGELMDGKWTERLNSLD